MPVPVLITKVRIPPMRPDVVIRCRLFDRLKEGSTRRMTLIPAPAGAGKTTLIVSWLHSLLSVAEEDNVPRIAWFSLEKEDNDPSRFLHHLAAAIESIDPEIGPELQPYFSFFHPSKLQHLLTLCLNRLAETPSECLLVLDDYHCIQNEVLHNAIGFFIDHLPSNCHVILATRETPLLPLYKWRARGDVAEIQFQELRFTGAETETFLNRTMGLGISTEASLILEAQTEGWIAGIQMAALTLRAGKTGPSVGGGIPSVNAVNGGNRYIIEYLAAEVLRQLPEEVRAFLRQTSVVDKFNAALCQALTGRVDCPELIAQLEKANIFLIPLDSDRRWYRYHHLFADFLRSALSEEEKREMHLRASRWLAANGMSSEAIRHSIYAGDTDFAVEVIRSGLDEMLRNGDLATVLEWVNALPEAVTLAESDLLVCKAWISSLGGNFGVSAVYADRLMSISIEKDPPINQGMVLTFRSFLCINRGQPVEAARFASEAVEILQNMDSFFYAAALTYLGIAEGTLGNRGRSIELLKLAMESGERLDNHLAFLEALAYLTSSLAEQGSLEEAISVCDETIRKYTECKARCQPLLLFVFLSMGRLCYEAGDLEQSHAYLVRGLALHRQVTINHPALLAHCTMAKLHFVADRIPEMEEALEVAQTLAVKSGSHRLIRLIGIVRAEIEIQRGQITVAVRLLQSLPAKPEDRSERENLCFARLYIAQGQLERAQELLQMLRPRAEAQDRHRSLIVISLREAILHQRFGRSEEVRVCMEQAISLAARGGYRRIFLDEGAEVQTLLRAHQSVAPAFVVELLRAFGNQKATAEKSAPVIAGATLDRPLHQEKLSSKQLQVLRLVAEGLSNRDIADKLKITEGTAKWHLNQIFGKLQVRSRSQAIAHAHQNRLL